MIIGTPFLTTEQIQKKVAELANRISRDYIGKEIIAIGILKGAFMFYADLIRMIQVPVTVDFIVASSYLKNDTTGEVKIHCDIRENLTGKHVLLIEDIIDTGISLNYIKDRILSMMPASLKIAVLLDKKERREVDVEMDYKGFEIPNKFIVGYGLDYENRYRNLPYLAIFKKKA
ncbi:MAG: hypoxanthine phosphoribosyltransferase [Dissulfurispiraceae bacterium]|jgi:hypoxanthine phosphoribosyltransferase|nr:hypoxanthine phosphoribosyltransferase [Dissulfurispiraceae bacterium]